MSAAFEDAIIVPQETALTEPFWEAARQGRAALQRCRSCGSVWHPPQPRCPTCQAADPEWFESRGKGEVHSYTVVRHAVHAAIAERLPYAVVLVELDEGPRIVCNLLDCPFEDIRVGMRVNLTSGPTPGGLVLTQAVTAREGES
jgi:uncharacterized OB-fold protein